MLKKGGDSSCQAIVHVAERTENAPSNLSFFMRSELEFRATVLESVLATGP